MSREPSAVRSSRASRYAPYSSRASALASTHPSSSSSIGGLPPPSGLHTTSYPSESHSYHQLPTAPAATFLGPPTTRSLSIPRNPPPISVTHPLSTPPQLGHSASQDFSFTQQPAHLAQLPFSQGPHRYPYPATNVLHSHPPMFHHIHSLPGDRSIQGERPSVDLRQRGTGNQTSVHQHPLQLDPGPASIQQGPTNYSNPGMFSGSWGFSINGGTFTIDNGTNSDNFMRELLQHTIIGAEYDSSDRYPPPRCHPGTRLAIIQRCKDFIFQCDDEQKMRWVVGPAGIGKSAIMQMVAEETPADASVFLSVNGRQDGWKILSTVAFQLATKHEPYHQFIRSEITRDPSLLRKLLPAQFNKFIVEPFVRRQLFNPSRRFLIIIDGLDECDNPITPLELLELISQFCITYPTSPIVWFIASRPEPHITAFFDDTSIAPAYSKEEIMIDSDDACEDVQLYLRAKLNKIKRAYPALRRKREWPSELEFTKIASAAGGLFAYASTVVRYISDPHYRDPVALLRHVLEDIDAGPTNDALGRDHSMAQLDALYQRILSNIPPDVMINTRKLLLIYSEFGWRQTAFRVQCNALGLTDDAAYGAVGHLHAVVQVPAPDRADEEPLEYFHKSFSDFLLDFERSGFCRNVKDEVEKLRARCSSRIIKEVPDSFDGMTSSERIACNEYGHLKGGPGILHGISLSWPCDENARLADDQLKCQLYTISMADMCHKFSIHQRYWSMFGFNALTTRFNTPGPQFPIYELRDSTFNNFLNELKVLGKLKHVPLRAIDYAAICGDISLQFTGPIWTNVISANSWNPSCEHQKHQGGGSIQGQQDWSTVFARSLADPGNIVEHADIPRFNIKAGKNPHWECVGGKFRRTKMCLYCSQRLARHFINNPDQLATVFVDSTDMCYVEFSFVDPDDGMSGWRYRFFHSGLPSLY